MEMIIGGIVMYVIGVGLNKLHDVIFVPTTKEGIYDARFRRGGFLGRLCNRLGIFIVVCGLIEIIFM